MAFNKVIVACVLLVIVAVHAADPEPKKLKCFQCKDCKEAKDADAKECPADETECYIYGDKSKENWNRGCTKMEKFCEKDTEASKKDIECTTCTKDECNSASFITSSIVLSAAALLVAKLIH